MLKCNLPPFISMNFQHATDCCMPLVGYILYIAKCKYARAVLFIRIHIYVCLPHSVKYRRILFCLPYVPTHLTTPVEMIITFFYFQVSLIHFSQKLTTYCQVGEVGKFLNTSCMLLATCDICMHVYMYFCMLLCIHLHTHFKQLQRQRSFSVNSGKIDNLLDFLTNTHMHINMYTPIYIYMYMYKHLFV